jgi:Glyoxalase-like domain
MQFIPGIDHLVVDVGAGLDQAESAYRSLGFHLSARGRHTLGSVNHVVVFSDHYLELLGTEEGKSARPDVAGFPEGLNGVVFASQSAERTYEALVACGVSAQQPISFSRPVDNDRNAQFDVIRLAPGEADFGRVYFCHHRTPDLVWNTGAQMHPNGAFSIARVQVATENPQRSTRLLRRMLGEESVRREADRWTIRVGQIDFEFLPPAENGVWAYAKGRRDYPVQITVVVASLAKAVAILRQNNIPGVIFEPHRIVVPARVAMNLAVEFVAA